MMEPFSWVCPYCVHSTTITESHAGRNKYDFNFLNKEGDLALVSNVITCPNPGCREYTIDVGLFKTETAYSGGSPYRKLSGPSLEHWALRPRSSAKPLPAYIPKPIQDDYLEACLIANDSPKASATLSRRCLQGMIRDFWGVEGKTLAQEVSAIQDKIDPTTWEAVDAVRRVGNIGAHMEKDINLIVEVDADEAGLLIGLIEFLLKDWYVGRHERQEHMKQVIALGAAKKTARKAAPPSP